MNRVKSSLLAAMALALLGESTQVQAQGAAAPTGTWQSTASPTRFVITPQGCTMYFQGRVRVAGTCSWNASSRGGILTITYPMPLEPGHVRYSVVWVDTNNITIFGEPFRRQ